MFQSQWPGEFLDKPEHLVKRQLRQQPTLVRVYPSVFGEFHMDWIERLLGLDLDGGDGSAEVMVVLACCVILAAVVAWRVPAFRQNIKAMFGNKARQ
jgi:hypothetical protein